MKKSIFLLILLLSVFGLSSNATVVYVDSAHIGGTQNGQSWATAFSSFQSGINAANSNDSVWVAQGTYLPPVDSSFIMKWGVKIFGGFLNTDFSMTQRNWQSHLTILKGNGNRVINNSNNNLTNAARLDGFIITNGRGTDRGGGMYNYLASPGIYNCTFSGNVVGNFFFQSSYGGGMYNSSSSPVISNCTFSHDTAFAIGSSGGSGSDFNAFGGALYNLCSSPVITGCTFSDNIAMVATSITHSSYGGAMYLNCGSPVITNCTFSNNKAYATSDANAKGGAMVITGNYSSPVISNCTFSDNTAHHSPSSYSGSLSGAILINGISTLSAPVINNCAFSNNTADDAGAIYIGTDQNVVTSSSVTTLNNCTFTGNIASEGYGGAVINHNASTIIDSCHFTGNQSLSSYVAHLNGGGAILNAFGANFAALGCISNCSFHNNSAPQAKGGAIWNKNIATFSNNNTLLQYNISNCKFSNNSSKTGGAIYNNVCSPFIINSLFSQNVAEDNGAAISNSGAATVIINCTMVRNSATNQGSAIYDSDYSETSISNSIIWGNDNGVYNANNATTNATYSLIQNFQANAGSFLMDGTTNPLFVDTSGAGNYHLLSGSPCVNAGNNDSMLADIYTDVEGNARISGGMIDMGAYERPLPPLVIFPDSLYLCAGDTITLSAQNYGCHYLWSTGDTSLYIKVNAAGIYYVTVTNSMGTSSDTVHVVLRTPPTITLGSDTTVCAGIVLTLDAQNTGSSYLWNDASTAQTLPVTASGIYYVRVTNSDLCSKTDSIYVNFINPTINLGNDTSICPGSILSLDAQNTGASYLWNNGASSQVITVHDTGIYAVSVTDINGCHNSDTIQVTFNESPVVNLGNDITINQGSSIMLDAGNPSCTYLWNTGAISPIITVYASGNYSVVVTNSFGCYNSDTILVSFIPLGVTDVNTPDERVTVSPNPAKETIYINIADLKLLHTRAFLTDTYGRLLRTVTIESKYQQLSLAGLAQDIYILKMERGVVVKIVKE